MKREVGSLIFILVCFSLFHTPAQSIDLNNEEKNEFQYDQVFTTRNDHRSSGILQSDPIIYIDGDLNFSYTAGNRSWVGDGFIGTPYIISGLEITSNSSFNPIEIRNTAVYFKINGSTLIGGAHGIKFDNVTHGTISDNSIANTNDSCIYLVDSPNNIINDNQASNAGGDAAYSNDCGIRLSNSANCTMINNILTNNDYCGIFLDTCANSTLEKNNALNNKERGIFLRKCPNSTLLDNNASNSLYGIYLEHSKNSSLKMSSVANQSKNGLYLTQSPNSTVEENVVTNSSDIGIYISYSANSTIKKNSVTDSGLDGIYAQYSENCYFFENSVTNSNRYGLYLLKSTGSIISANLFTNNGFYLYHTDLEGYLQYAVSSNFVNGKPLIYWENITEGIVPEGTGQVILFNCSNIEIGNQNLSMASVGVQAFYSPNLSIHDNVIQDNYYGVWLKYSNHSICSNNVLSGNDIALKIDSDSGNSTIINNYLANDDYGLTVQYAGNCTIENNIFEHCGIYISGGELSDYFQSSVQNNTVNGKSLLYWENVKGGTIPNGVGQIILINSPNVIIESHILEDTSVAVLAAFSNNLTIHNCLLRENFFGINLGYCNNTIISNNTILNNGYEGIYLLYSSNSVLFNNTIVNSTRHGLDASWISDTIFNANKIVNSDVYGIYIARGVNCTVYNNIVDHNENTGLYFYYSENSTLSYNVITGNGYDGVYIHKSHYNTIKFNTISNSTRYGLGFHQSMNNTATNNSVAYSLNYGVSMYSNSNNNSIMWNSFFGNYLQGTSSQGYDGSSNNIFDYNHWDDWIIPDDTPVDGIVDLPYDLWPITNSDPHPLTTPTTTHQMTSLYIWHPMAGDNVSGIVTIQWSMVVDTRNHPVTYNVSYSDGGSSWTDLASDLTSVTYAWDTNGITNETDYRVKVVATGGLSLTVEKVSNLFSIRNIAHTITTPTLSYPIGGEILSDNVTIQWETTVDSWGDAITYSVYYSADGGTTWVTLATDLTNNSYEWDTTTVGDGNYWIKVLAVCSTGHSAEAIIPNSFTILNNPQPTKPSKDDGLTPVLIIGLVGVAVIGAGAVLYIRRRKLG